MSDRIDRLNAALKDRYRIVRELGEGGMATVYLARDLRHNRDVALKVLKPELAAVLGTDRFLAEIETTAKLQHPHILPLFDSGEAAGGPYYVMPYVEGESLRERIDVQGPLPVGDALRIASECGEALEYAHRQGVVHRDVKPSNVLLSADHAVLADFGVARALEAAAGREALTSTGVTLGTVGYMSPEQASGEREVDARADVYALGCVLYEMLTAEPPFPGATPYAVVARQLEGPAPVTGVRPSVPEAVERTIRRACQPTPGDRFASAEELVRAIRGVDGTAVGAGRRDRTAFAWLTAAAVVLLMAIGTWAAVSGPFATHENSDLPELAVLPFDNLSPDPDNDYFAAGVHLEILTHLSRIDGIRTISRTSVRRYEDSEMSSAEIADELGVSSILEGGVQVADGQVRISLQLSDANGRALWGERYERQLSDIFQIQTDVATRVVKEVGGVLTPQERAELAERPTDDLDAYTQYLRGREHLSRFLAEPETRAAVEAYERAVALDPTFVQAWARLVQARLWLSWVWAEFDERDRAREDLRRLEELAPESAELRFARGFWLYYGAQRYEEAVEEFEAVADLWPGDEEVMLFRGALYRRMGRFDESLAIWERSLAVDPANGSIAYSMAQSYTTLRRFDEAERYATLAVDYEPTFPVHWWHLVFTRMARGDMAAARAALDSAGRRLEEAVLHDGGWWALWQVHTGDVEDALESYRRLYRRSTFDGTWWLSWDLGLAGAAGQQRTNVVRSMADTLRAQAERSLASVPQDSPIRRSRLLARQAVANAYLGNDEAAVRLANEAVHVFPNSRDSFLGPLHVLRQAHVYAVVGRHEEAIERLRYLLSIPARGVTVPLMRLDPRWDPLREDPAFQALLEGSVERGSG